VRKFLICQGSRVVLLAKGKRLHQGKKPGLEKKFLRDEPCIYESLHFMNMLTLTNLFANKISLSENHLSIIFQKKFNAKNSRAQL